MEKNAKIGIAALLIIVIAGGVGGGFGAWWIINQPEGTTEEPTSLVVSDGILDISFTMSELKSNKYTQADDVTLFYKTWSGLENGTYDGVSVRSILEVEKMLYSGANNFSFIGGDDYNPVIVKGIPWLNISKIMSAPYDQCILAYGGDDFDPADGPFRAFINQSLVPEGVDGKKYTAKNTTKILFNGVSNGAYTPLTPSDAAVTIHSEILQYHLTETELKSSSYQQISNEMFVIQKWSGQENHTLSGVSLKSIFEEDDLLGSDAVNYTFVSGTDGFDPVITMGFPYLNLTTLMNAEYEECALTYGGTDWDVADGPFYSAVNLTACPSSASRTNLYFVTNTTEVRVT